MRAFPPDSYDGLELAYLVKVERAARNLTEHWMRFNQSPRWEEEGNKLKFVLAQTLAEKPKRAA